MRHVYDTVWHYYNYLFIWRCLISKRSKPSLSQLVKRWKLSVNNCLRHHTRFLVVQCNFPLIFTPLKILLSKFCYSASNYKFHFSLLQPPPTILCFSCLLQQKFNNLEEERCLVTEILGKTKSSVFIYYFANCHRTSSSSKVWEKM